MAMTLEKLIKATVWSEIEAALTLLFPEEQENLPDYLQVFRQLGTMTPERNSMRIAIEPRPLQGFDEDPVPEVVGRNGTLNRDLADCPLSERGSEYGFQEAVYSLSLQSWRKWLGMAVDPATLQAYNTAQIVAYVLSDMTFYGFTEAENRAFLKELNRRVDEIDAMTDEERKEKLIPSEQVFAELKQKYGIEEPGDDG